MEFRHRFVISALLAFRAPCSGPAMAPRLTEFPLPASGRSAGSQYRWRCRVYAGNIRPLQSWERSFLHTVSKPVLPGMEPQASR